MAMDRADRYACVADVTGALAGLTLPVPLAVTGSSPTSSSVVRTTTGIGTKAVAVLPLRNLGPPEDEYLADGLTDDLIDNLSMTGGIRVRSRGMVMGLRGADRDPRELGRDLGVQVVVLGSVRRAGDRLRVQARVISVADGFQLWAKRFDCPASDFLAVGDEMVRAVADALTGTGEPPRPRQPPADPAAIDLYLRARHAHHTAWRDAGRVVGLFQQALARAPDDPMFLSGYAMAQIRVFAHDDGASLAGEEAKLAAERALAVAPELGEARVALATYLLCVGDAVGAAREVTRALASSPGLADAHDLAGRILIEAGASDQGVASLKRALSFEPRLTVSAMALAREHALRGEETLAEEMLRMGEHDPVTETVRGYTRARLALWTGDRERVKTVLGVLGANGAALGPFESLRAFAGGPLGDPRDGLELARLATAGGKAARRRSFYGQIRAELYLFLGEREMALTALEGADAAHLFDVVWLDRCPIFAPLRGDPRFVAVRAHVAERARLVLEAFGIASP
jgi:serine/threonine-protein kinase